MKKRDDRVYLYDILDSIQQIDAYVAGVSYESFSQDRLRQDAVVRRPEIIGEAARNLTDGFRSRHPEIPWSQIIGMRHKIAHDYFQLDLPTIWDTIHADLPPLRQWLEKQLQR